jgi:hypothetical protein
MSPQRILVPDLRAPLTAAEMEAERQARWEKALEDLWERVELMRDAARACGYRADAARLDHMLDLLDARTP